MWKNLFSYLLIARNVRSETSNMFGIPCQQVALPGKVSKIFPYSRLDLVVCKVAQYLDNQFLK